MSRVAAGLSLIAGGAFRPARSRPFPEGEGDRERLPETPPALESYGPTLSELFGAAPRDGGWAGFLLAHLRALDPATKPLLWVQDRMAILEAGRVHPPGLGAAGTTLIHVEARDARDALWAMEEGLRCSGLSAVVGELWGNPAALDFTATRRLAVAAERHGVAAFLIRLGGHANLSGARRRWRIRSAPSIAHPFDPKAPGDPAWDAELFRARGAAPGRWTVRDEAGRFLVVADAVDRPLAQGDEGERRRA